MNDGGDIVQLRIADAGDGARGGFRDDLFGGLRLCQCVFKTKHRLHHRGIVKYRDHVRRTEKTVE